MKILSILVCYGTGKTTPALSDLKSLHDALRVGNHYDYLVSDNAMVPGFTERLDQHTMLIGGDNGLREFSGFQLARYSLWARAWPNTICSTWSPKPSIPTTGITWGW